MKKRIFAILLTVVMVMALVPTSVFGIDIDKTATDLENNQTTVTLEVGGTQEVEKVAVLFVLDYSTSVTVRDEAASFIDELADKANTNVKVCVINYWADADEGTWTTITDETSTSELLSTDKSGGTNYHAGLLAAQKALNSDEIEGYTTYLITISDGITYLWGNSAMTVPYAMVGSNDTVSTPDGTVSVWDMTYKEGTPLITTDDTTGVYESWDGFFSGMTTKLTNTESYFTKYGTEYDSYIKVYNSDNKNYNDGAGNTETLATYATNVEVAIYETATTYEALAKSVDYAYAFKMDENHWSAYPWGEQLMDYLIDASDNSGDIASGEISGTTAADVFSTIKDQILYEIMSGTVTDVIGEDFDWVGMDTVALTVGETELTGTVDGNTVTFGTDENASAYVVTYYPDETDEYGNVTKGEYFTWEINVPVEAANGLTLSYDLELTDGYTLPTDKSYEVLPTNEEAKIEYVDPDGDTKEDDFPVPTVIVGEKKSEPGLEKWIVTTDNNTVKQDDVAAGDTVEFQLTSNVPDLYDYMDWTYDEKTGTATATPRENATYTLTFHDEMDEALTFDESSVTVTIGDKVLVNTDDATYYTVTTSVTDECTFEVSMDLIELYSAEIITVGDWASTAIVVTYKATLSKDASAGTYENTAWVSYPDSESEKDTVEVDTYGISVFKYDQATATYATETVDETGTETTSTLAYATGLAGAEFTVYSDEDCTVEIATITTGTDGYATLEGLDAGTYYLVETKAPSGYVCSEETITVTIEGGGNKTTNIYSVSVANAEIPSTGGAGTVIFTVVGGGLIVAAAAVLVISRRKHEDEE